MICNSRWIIWAGEAIKCHETISDAWNTSLNMNSFRVQNSEEHVFLGLAMGDQTPIILGDLIRLWIKTLVPGCYLNMKVSQHGGSRRGLWWNIHPLDEEVVGVLLKRTPATSMRFTHIFDASCWRCIPGIPVNSEPYPSGHLSAIETWTYNVGYIQSHDGATIRSSFITIIKYSYIYIYHTSKLLELQTNVATL